jgi:hypothetical protein
MRVAEDIVATNGLVLIGRGVVVTELVLDRLTNYARTIEIIEPVLAVPGGRSQPSRPLPAASPPGSPPAAPAPAAPAPARRRGVRR